MMAIVGGKANSQSASGAAGQRDLLWEAFADNNEQDTKEDSHAAPNDSSVRARGRHTGAAAVARLRPHMRTRSHRAEHEGRTPRL